MSDERSHICGAGYGCTCDAVEDIAAERDAAEDELARLRALIRIGLAVGQKFKTAYAAGARAELRRMAGMGPR